jgi:2-polyprenyl-3-methyl-5-hydroxy-6-metoxy-1,4-benzoquinol methylase
LTDHAATRKQATDPARLDALAELMTNEVGAALGCALVVVGDKLGLYKALASHGPLGAEGLAARTDLSERMVREWLLNQAAGGYVSYDPQTEQFSLSPEQEALLADETSPVFLPGAFQFATAMIKAEERISEVFRTGRGMRWGEHHGDLFTGLARFSRPIYTHKLCDVFIPAVPGLAERLQAGATVADIGCGHGHSTMLMAERFGASRFFGFDNHPDSVQNAERVARERGLSERVRFEVAEATSFPQRSYDVIAFFNCMHDVAHADACAAHCLRALKPDGYVFMVEPIGGDRVEQNFTAGGRLMSGASVLCCTPHGMVDGGAALGTVVADERLEGIMRRAGFKSFRRVMSTRYNRVIEVRP